MANASELRKLAETDTIQEIPKEQYGPVITNPPFVFVDGSFNTRDLGLVPDSPIRAGFIYRSGALTTLTDNGKAVMAGKLGIKRVFDIRSPEEREKGPDPEIEGVENTWHRNARPDSTPDLDKFVSGVGEAGYEDMYLEVIDVYSAAWKDILEHIRDRPSDPLMYHCTGKIKFCRVPVTISFRKHVVMWKWSVCSYTCSVQLDGIGRVSSQGSSSPSRARRRTQLPSTTCFPASARSPCGNISLRSPWPERTPRARTSRDS